MSDIIPFNHAGGSQLPAHIVSAFGDESNIGPRQTIDQLSYRGKQWRRVINGEEHPLMKKDSDTGEMVPVQIVSLVVLDQNRARSRSYYEGSFEEGKNTPPRCFSSDGEKPDASVKEPLCATCKACPKSVKGSKITENGKEVTACATFKRLAVVPANANIMKDHPPLLLRIAQTSMWDKDNQQESAGWYAWDQYTDMLRARGAKHTAAVETRVKFDNTAYPKLLFSASRWLDPSEVAAVRTKMTEAKDAIEAVLNGGGADGTTGTNGTSESPATPAPTGDAAAAQAAKEAEAQAAAARQAAEAKQAADAKAAADAAAAQAAQAAQAAATVEAKRIADLEAQLAAAKAAATVPAPAAAAGGDEWGSGGVTNVTPTRETPAPVAAAAAPTPTPAASQPAVVDGTPQGLKDLLGEWADG